MLQTPRLPLWKHHDLWHIALYSLKKLTLLTTSWNSFPWLLWHHSLLVLSSYHNTPVYSPWLAFLLQTFIFFFNTYPTMTNFLVFVSLTLYILHKQKYTHRISTTLWMPMISKAIYSLMLSLLIPNHNFNYLDIS